MYARSKRFYSVAFQSNPKRTVLYFRKLPLYRYKYCFNYSD